MKQLLIVTYDSALGANDITALKEGQLRVSLLNDPTKAISTKPTSNFSLALGRGENLLPFIIPEVDVNSLTASLAKKSAAVPFAATITIPDEVVAGLDYTVMVVKKGKVFNERAKWTVTERALEGMEATDIAQHITDYINNNDTIGLKATVEGAAITVTGSSKGEDYEIIATDALNSDAVEVTANGAPAIGDKAYIQDLALKCAAGKGVKYLGEDGAEIYPGFPENVPDTSYQVFTLRFAVHRDSAKQRDEVVYQTVHIAVKDGSAVATSLKTVFGVS